MLSPHNVLYTDNGWRFTIAIVIAYSSWNGQYVTSPCHCIHTVLITPTLTAAIMVLPEEPFIEKFILKLCTKIIIQDHNVAYSRRCLHARVCTQIIV